MYIPPQQSDLMSELMAKLCVLTLIELLCAQAAPADALFVIEASSDVFADIAPRGTHHLD